MDQADPHHAVLPRPQAPKPAVEVKKVEAQAIEAEVVSENAALDAANYKVTFGKFKGMCLGEIPLDELKGYCNYILDKANMSNGGRVSGMALEFMLHAEVLTGINRSGDAPEDDGVPF